MNTEIEKQIQKFSAAALEKGDFKTPSKLDHKLHKDMCIAYEKIISFGEDGEAAFKKLLSHDNDHIKSWVASQLLYKNGDEEAEAVLTKLMSIEGIQGFNAKMVLQQYEKGTLGSPFGEYGR